LQHTEAIASITFLAAEYGYPLTIERSVTLQPDPTFVRALFAAQPNFHTGVLSPIAKALKDAQDHTSKALKILANFGQIYP